MIIEFIGLPGSGKTTYYYKIRNATTIGRDSLENVPLSLKQYLVFTLKNSKLYIYLILGILYNFELDLKRWYALMLGVHGTWIQYVKIFSYSYKNKNNTIVMDEGLLQRSLSVFYFNERKWNPVLFNKVINVLHKKKYFNKIVFFKIKPEKSLLRCTNRKSGLPYRYKKFDQDTILNKFNYLLSGMEKIESKFSNQIEYIINE